MTTEEKIISETTKIFALKGGDGFNIRDLSTKVGVAPSVIYHYFSGRDQLLKKMFRHVGKKLGEKRHKLPQTADASAALRSRILFQFENATEVAAVLKYYLYERKIFPKIKTGYLPDRAYLHIEEVLKLGLHNHQFYVKDIRRDSKVIAHAINGFVLEYYPNIPVKKELSTLVDQVHDFLLRALLRPVDKNKKV